MGNWFYEGKYSVQFTVDNVTKDSWEDFKMIPEKKPVMQAPDLGLRLFKRFEFSQTYIIEDNDEVDNIIDDIIEYLHGKTGSITVGENTYTALFNVADVSAEDHYTTFRLQAILSDFDPEDPDNTLDFGDFNTWTDWHLIPDETLKIVPPQLKEKYVDIPGRNGAIDLCNAVVGLPRFERMTGSLNFTIYDNDPDSVYNDILDNLHGQKFDEVEIMGKSYDGRWVVESYEPDGEEPKITLGYNLILHDWTFNEDPDATGEVDIAGNNYYSEVFFLDKREFCLGNSLCRLIPCNSSSVYIYNINWSTDNWEIGIAFKRTTNNAKAILFGQGHDGWNWHYVPNCEVFDSGVLNIYYSSSGSNWNPAYNTAINPNAGNDWMFVKVTYDPTNKTLTLSYTKDFETFIDNVATDIYLHSNTDPMAIGYFPGYNHHTNSDMHFDLYNCYIKKDDELIWGCNTNEFPESQVSS